MSTVQTATARWGETRTLSSGRELKITPAEWHGGLIVTDDNRWVGGRFGNGHLWIGDSSYVGDDGHCYVPFGSPYAGERGKDRQFGLTRPLLPPRAKLTVEEAFDALSWLVGANLKSRTNITLPLEVGHMQFILGFDKQKITAYYHPECEADVRYAYYNEDNYAARGRDWRLEGKLRRWLAGQEERNHHG